MLKLTPLDKLFVRQIRDFIKGNNQTITSTMAARVEITEWMKQENMKLRRQKDANLNKAFDRAMEFLIESGAIENSVELSDDNEDELIEPISNVLNDSLVAMYLSNQNAAVEASQAVETNLEEVEPEREKRKKSTREQPAKKQKTTLSKYPTPTTRLSDLGGIDEAAQDLLQLIGMPLLHPEIFRHLGIDPPRGILLQGAPGCGKTLLAHAIAGETGVPFISIAAPTIVSGMSGESEKKIREVFEEAKELAPCILFIDEIDAITPKRETAQREMERRIVAQLLTSMDDVSLEKTDYKPVIVIGATNRPDSLDPALRRAGRFDREITLGVPDEEGRTKIITKMCSKLKIDGEVSFQELARLTPGFVGADLNALMGEAGMIAVKRIFSKLALQKDTEMDSQDEPIQDTKLTFSAILQNIPATLTEPDLEPLSINYSDFVAAIDKVQPSSKREGFATIPGVSWSDIGALVKVRDELRMAVVEPIKHPEYFTSVGITSSMGVLLYGPPGCGKTLLAKAVANESHCNFLSVKGPELLNKYVGESERAIRLVFSRAQASSPCIIFFDELDAICPSRNNDSESQSSSRLVNTLLTEMDGMQGRNLVFVIAATNRPDMIDAAMLRPGRLDKCLYVDLPDTEERESILRTLTRNTPMGDVDLSSIAKDERTDGMSGADLASLVREAGVSRIRSCFYGSAPDSNEKVIVGQRDFEVALGKVRPSVLKNMRKKYELLKVKFGSA